MADTPAAAELRRLRRSLSVTWAIAWLMGLSALALVAIRASAERHAHDLDAELSLHAIAAYGLTWRDADGAFHDELFYKEEFLVASPFDIWVVEPGESPTIHLQPKAPRFDVPELSAIAQRIVSTKKQETVSGRDRRGAPYRLRAIPTYDDADQAWAAILVFGDPTPADQAQARFVRRVLLMTGALALAGLAVGIYLAGRSLRPLLVAMAQRERFLAAAAHELRTPVAGIRAVCESALAGDEDAATALQRLRPLSEHTATVVDDLLLFVRLDAGAAALAREPVRLDLLVEACVPEGSDIALAAQAIVASVDPRLVRVAVRNLVENAQTHGRRSETSGEISIAVQEATVIVEDRGPGFSAEVLSKGPQPFAKGAGSQGTGLGLAIAHLVAQLHGGALALANRPDGGGRVTLRLAPGGR